MLHNESVTFAPEDMYEKYQAEILDGKESLKENYAKKMTEWIISCIASVLGTAAVFVLSLLLLKVLSALFEALFRLPLLKTVNKLGGGVVGLVLGLVYAFLICTAIHLLLPYIPENPVIYMGMEEDTVIYKFFVSANPLMLLFLNSWR